MYIVYKIVNIINNKFYIGVHKTDYINDSYMGSGTIIKKAICKYGLLNFIKEVLFIFESMDEAYKKEYDLLENIWQNNNCYNVMPGGIGSWDYVNSLGLENPMLNKNIVKNHVYNKHINGSYYTEAAKKSQIKNLDKAIMAWSGSTHKIETKEIIAESTKKYWSENYDNCLKDLRKWRNRFTIQSPDGIIHNIEPGELNGWCKKNEFAVSCFSTKPIGYVIKRGKAKGWKIINKN